MQDAAGFSFSAAVFAISAVVVALLFFRHKRDGRRWAAAAAQLGLTVDPRPHHHGWDAAPLLGSIRRFNGRKMAGQREGLDVEVGTFLAGGDGDDDGDTHYTYVRARYPEALGIGLQVMQRGMTLRALGPLLGAGVPIGDPELDRRYHISATDVPTAVATLAPSGVRAALRRLEGTTFKLTVEDDHLRYVSRGKHLAPETLEIVLDAAVELARCILAGRQEAGPNETERALSAGWRQVAERRGLTLDLENRRLLGRFEGAPIEVATFVRERQRWTSFTTRFERPLGVGLRVTRQGGLDDLKKLIGMQDIEVGDPRFDGRFVVKGAPEARVKELLTPEVREALLALQSDATNLLVDDDRLVAEVSWLVSDASSLESGLIATARASAALAQVAQHELGPYRR